MKKQKAIYQRFLLLAALPAFMLASCSQEETTGAPDIQNGEIRFEIGFAPQTEAVQRDAQTRVATDTKLRSTWEAGDAIGLFAVEHGKGLAAAGNYIHNVRLTYMADGTWTASEDLYWPAGSTKLDFYAYHPYAAEANDPTSVKFDVETDQSASTGGKSNYNFCDVLMAKNDNLGNGCGKGETVRLTFKHALAMVQVNVSKSMVGDYDPDALDVWLNGCTTDGVLNLSTLSVTPPAEQKPPVQIKMYPCPNDGDDASGIYAYRALVPAQEIAAGTVLFSFGYDGGTLLRSDPLAQSLSLVAGTAETFDMTFPFTSATVSADVRLDHLFTGVELAAITRLKVMGEMTAADFYTIKEKMPVISLDLSAATVKDDAIPENALRNKTSLKEFVFPRNIKTIGEYAFDSCSGLTGSLTIPQGVTTIGNYAFWGCSGFTGSLTIPQGVTTIGDDAFYGCSGFTGSLTIPQGVTTIGNDAFFNCSGFTGSLTIPEGVTTIGEYAFFNCSGFNGSLTIPQGVQTIGEYAFYGCSGFNGSLTIPQGVTTIGDYAFEHCSGFNGSLTIPEGVQTIGNYAFWGCSNLASITCHVLKPETVEYGNDVFGGIPGGITVYVPKAAVNAYKEHAVWNEFFKTFEPIPQP